MIKETITFHFLGFVHFLSFFVKLIKYSKINVRFNHYEKSGKNYRNDHQNWPECGRDLIKLYNMINVCFISIF